VRNTSLIEISVLSDKPEEAAKHANAVAEVYKEHRLRQWKERSMAGVSVL
jgi:capsular polysaccharide biosynthesis protein